jgi:hypothetical protein
MRSTLWDFVTAAIMDRCHTDGCTWGLRREKSYREGFLRYGDFGQDAAAGMTVHELAESIRSHTDERGEAQYYDQYPEPVDCGYPHEFCEANTFASRFDAMKEGAGLCLDCIRVRGAEACEAHKDG